MIGNRWRISAFCAALMGLVLICGGVGAQEEPFPSYGEGSVEVRIYTDYFCPPCRAMEAEVEPILEDLVMKRGIRLTFVDTPVYKNTPLYARYFLYALMMKNDFAHALHVRRILFEAAGRNVTEEVRLKTALAEKGIMAKAFDIALVIKRYNEMIKADHISGTPTCVIIRNGQKKAFVGGPEIVNALKGLL